MNQEDGFADAEYNDKCTFKDVLAAVQNFVGLHRLLVML